MQIEEINLFLSTITAAVILHNTLGFVCSLINLVNLKQLNSKLETKKMNKIVAAVVVIAVVAVSNAAASSYPLHAQCRLIW